MCSPTPVCKSKGQNIEEMIDIWYMIQWREMISSLSKSDFKRFF